MHPLIRKAPWREQGAKTRKEVLTMNDFTDLSGQTQLVFKDTTIRATYDEKGTPVFCAKAFKARCGVLRTHHWWAGWCRVGRRSRGFLGRGVGLEHQYGAWV